MYITRFAPSPTGLLHSGNYRTGLFSYLMARQSGGKFILRIEDTDAARSKKEYEENILESLKWLGLEYDAFYRQTDEKAKHRALLEKLVAEDKAYVSKETPKEEGGRAEVIRLRNPGTKVTFHDMIRGEITFDTAELGDFVIAKSFDEPIFHFAVVADDISMGVTLIIRGDDHISNTPRQILISRALGAPDFTYAHLPIVLASDRSKLSKRKGALPITAFRDLGYLPEAVINYLAFLGWNPGDDRELMSKEELIRDFRIDRVQKGGAIFDEKKMRWYNKEYIKKMPVEVALDAVIARIKKAWQGRGEATAFLGTTAALHRLATTLLDRIEIFSDVETLLAGDEFNFMLVTPKWNAASAADLVWKKQKPTEAGDHLTKAAALLTALSESDFADAAKIKNALWPFAEGLAAGKGALLWPLRMSLTGAKKSPDPFTVASLIGKEETLARINNAITSLKTLAEAA